MCGGRERVPPAPVSGSSQTRRAGSPRPWCTRPRCEAGASRRLHVELAALEAVRKAARWRGQQAHRRAGAPARARVDRLLGEHGGLEGHIRRHARHVTDTSVERATEASDIANVREHTL
ncbi:hypothetical protein AB1Y20_015806 [Prymnesium parvum]|uniref:Uncharacterized protein n=1 Tax=Prymnesium parvum TaxID=97485 RepID=A0AB34K407_PRYPA